MATKPVSDELFAYIMDVVGGTKFESFAKLITAAEHGGNFTPLGGMHDGGADGLLSSFIFQGDKPNTFLQFSVTDGKNAKAKVKQTIAALRKAGRAPSSVIYCTSESLPKQDVLQQEIFDEEQVLATIRDRHWIKGIVARNTEANRRFYETFASEISHLSQARAEISGAMNEVVEDPTILVFLNYELRDRSSKGQLLSNVADALIYWSLRDTDPDSLPEKKLLSRSMIAASIQDIFPTAKSLLLPQLNARLAELSKKRPAELERLRYYRDVDSFCLPFDMRSVVAGETAKVQSDQIKFEDSIKNRVEVIDQAQSKTMISKISDVVFHTIHCHFVDQGLLLAAFLEKKTEKLLKDQIVEEEMRRVLADRNISGVGPDQLGIALKVLRGIFYDPSADEHHYLGYLSRTSMLFTTLNVSPKLLEYFNQMGGDFRLLVGTDMLVKAISETYLEEPSRQVTNILKVMSKLGAKLIFAEPVAEELFTHLHGVDLEFRNHYASAEQYIKDEDIAECNRILIRTYLYAKKFAKGPRTWGDFINDFVDVSELRSKSVKGRQQLNALLCQRFKMKFISFDDLESGVNPDSVATLAGQLQSARGHKHEELSKNDALMAHAVYAQRRIHDESATYDGFGQKTWWLTKETHVLGLTGELVRERGTPYIMRPEFLLNFITLAPKAAEVRAKYSNILPTTVGLQLGRHLDPGVMQNILKDVEDWSRQQPDRVGIMMSERVNKLKFDRFKQYLHNVP